MDSSDLLSRLQAASEGSAELDRDVLIACGWHQLDNLMWAHVSDPWTNVQVPPCPTRSLDDITRMIEAEQRGWNVWTDHFFGPAARVQDTSEKSVLTSSIIQASTPCLALCLAFLRARATP